MSLSTGSRLGPYEIIAPLGAGGMGEVYRARDARLGRDVAIKVLPSRYSADPERLRRFEQEARAAAALNHPDILVIYDIGSHEGSPYVVSELLEGATLRERLSGGGLPQRKAVEYALDVARGLAAAHSKGIAHRDLKPENLFVTRDGRVKILDFGLAKLMQPDPAGAGRSKAPTMGIDTDPGMILGTAGYMAPEQVRGEPADHRADLFALGAVLHEMLSGSRPFHRATAVETMNAILNEEPPDLSQAPRPVSPALERIVAHCLEKDPAARFQSAQDVAFNLEALSGLSEPSGAIARPGGIRRKLGSGARILLASAAILALALVAGWALARMHPRAPASYRQLTFREGAIYSARFLPDGQTYIYAAALQGSPLRIYTGRFGSPESRALGYEGVNIFAVSSKGEMALCVGAKRQSQIFTIGMLATALVEGGAPREVLADVLGADWSPDGSSLAVIRAGDTFRLEYPIGTLLFETKGWVSDARVSPSGETVAFLFHPVRPDDRGSVMVVDRSRKTRTISQGWSTEQGLAWSHDGKEVWFTAGSGVGNRELCAASLSGKMRVVARIPGSMTLQDISRDGRVLLTSADERGDLYAFAPGDNTERDLTWFEFSFPADISPDGTTVLFTEQGTAAGDLYSVFVRKMDGSPAARLGEGEALAFSPDAKSVLALLYTSPPRLNVLPMGAGEVKRLPNPGFERFSSVATWTADGRAVVFGAERPGRPMRCYVQSLDTGAVRPVTPEGVDEFVANARGDTVYTAIAGAKPRAFPVDGGPSHEVSMAGLEDGDHLIRMGSDGRSVYLFRDAAKGATVFSLDIQTRRRTLLRELKPGQTAGLVGIPGVAISPDGRAIAFMGRRYLTRMYLAEGLR